jgi:hypothetical protein
MDFEGINGNQEGLDRPVTSRKIDIVGLYTLRMLEEHWNRFDEYASEVVEHLSLYTFVRRYKRVGKKISVIRQNSKPAVFRYSPEVKCVRESPDYWKYCLVSLLKHKPWINHRENVYWYGENTLPIQLSATNAEVRSHIKTKFNEYFRTPGIPSFGQDDPLHRAVDNAGMDLDFPSPGTDHSIDGEDMLNGLIDGFDDEYDTVEGVRGCEVYDRVPDFIMEELLDAEGTKDRLTANVENPEVRAVRAVRRLTDFDLMDEGQKQQHDTVVVFLKMLGLWFRERTNAEGVVEKVWERVRHGENCTNAMLVPGPAGTGKSFLIDCIVAEAEERYLAKEGKEGFVHIVAPTGKAAMGVGGYTMQSDVGLHVPCNKGAPLDESNGDRKRFQQLLNVNGEHGNGRHFIAVVVDDYSMVSSKQMYWISERLQEAAVNVDNAFGGVCIVLFGDPAQFAPVAGSALWRSHLNDANTQPLTAEAQTGHNIYMQIETVMDLNVVRRQDGEYRNHLGRLRKVQVTLNDVLEFWNRHCTREGIGEDRYSMFETDLSTTFIYFSNEKCVERNILCLKNQNKPIMRIKAVHDDLIDSRSAAKSSAASGDLERVLLLCIGAKVMLRKNLATHLGLVNGSPGKIIEIVYEDRNDPAVEVSIPL